MSRNASSRRRVFVTRPIAESQLRRLAVHARIDLWDDEMPPPHDELVARLRRSAGVLSMISDRLDAETIASASHLRTISNFADGVDNIDLRAATAAGVSVGHTPGILTETTADLAFALLMAVARRVVEAAQYVRAGLWKTWGPRVMLGRDVFGATLGIIGWGAIGRAMARRAGGFEMRVLYTTEAGGRLRRSNPEAAAPSVPVSVEAAGEGASKGPSGAPSKPCWTSPTSFRCTCR